MAKQYMRLHLEILLTWEIWINFVYFGAIVYDQLKWVTRLHNCLLEVTSETVLVIYPLNRNSFLTIREK